MGLMAADKYCLNQGVSMNEIKEQVRKTLIAKRSSLSDEEVREKSRIITERLIRSEFFKNSKSVLAYMNKGKEVGTEELIKCCLSEGKAVCLPLVLREQSKLEIYRIYDLSKDLRQGVFGIREPIALPENRVDIFKIDIVVIPGVGFDEEKNRIGYGKGFYDRFLKQLNPGTLKIALAFDCQMLKELPADSLDIKMDIIITENRMLV